MANAQEILSGGLAIGAVIFFIAIASEKFRIESGENPDPDRVFNINIHLIAVVIVLILALLQAYAIFFHRIPLYQAIEEGLTPVVLAL